MRPPANIRDCSQSVVRQQVDYRVASSNLSSQVKKTRKCNLESWYPYALAKRVFRNTKNNFFFNVIQTFTGLDTMNSCKILNVSEYSNDDLAVCNAISN